MPVRVAEKSARSRLWQAVKGLGISGLNPKVFLLFLALLPQFTDPAARRPPAVQIAVLGLVHLAGGALIHTRLGTSARRLLRMRQAAALWVTPFSGAALIVIGAVLLIERPVG